ncbi:unnamed protein product [[Candida] boidinii]|nr:unnamed protein product [[Candida] boidinii]
MIAAAVEELASGSPAIENPKAGLLAPVEVIDETSAKVATAVILQALKEGVARIETEESPSGGFVKVPRDFEGCLAWVKGQMWRPVYRPLIKVEHVDSIHTHQY